MEKTTSKQQRNDEIAEWLADAQETTPRDQRLELVGELDPGDEDLVGAVDGGEAPF